MKNIVMIQARLGSTRLPGKIFLMLQNKTILEHVIDRTKKSNLIDEVIVVTTIQKVDLEVVRFCAERSIRVFCGSEEDVLDRYYQCAKLVKADNIIRITSDCPLIDPEVIDLVITNHVQGAWDYTSNTIIETFPDGEDVEVISFNSLEKAWKESTLLSEREHVTPYIKKNKNIFKLHNVELDINHSEKRWTIDQQEDYEFLINIFNELYPIDNYFSMKDILELLKNRPELSKINSSIERNEGYKKSFNNDKQILKNI